MSETPDIILHQYAMSPFSEKLRKVLAIKRLPYAAVDQPMWSPKPKLTPLTGGYRRIPVMQIGADVYCDTACIVRALEARHPTPTVVPSERRGAAEMIAWWADRQLFAGVVALVLGAVGHTLPPEFKADREKMVPGLKFENLGAGVPHARDQVRAFSAALERQLADTPFLLGAEPTLADAACFHVYWFARMDPNAGELTSEFPALQAWFARVDDLGQGDATPLDPDRALAIAKSARPATVERVDPRDAGGLTPGRLVAVTPDDYAFDPVAGEIVALGPSDVAIRRHDPEVGEIVVHFPRAGFRVTAA